MGSIHLDTSIYFLKLLTSVSLLGDITSTILKGPWYNHSEDPRIVSDDMQRRRIIAEENRYLIMKKNYREHCYLAMVLQQNISTPRRRSLENQKIETQKSCQNMLAVSIVFRQRLKKIPMRSLPRYHRTVGFYVSPWEQK